LVEIQDDTDLLILCKASAPYQIHRDSIGLPNVFCLFLFKIYSLHFPHGQACF